MANNTIFNVSEVYTQVVEDNGATYLGEFARKYNKQVGSMLMELMVYASKNHLPNPANIVKLDDTKGTRKMGSTIKINKSGINIAPSRLKGTSLETASEVEFKVTDEGILLVPVSSDIVDTETVSIGEVEPVTETSSLNSTLDSLV